VQVAGDTVTWQVSWRCRIEYSFTGRPEKLLIGLPAINYAPVLKTDPVAGKSWQ
jgi:hypothetical protein